MSKLDLDTITLDNGVCGPLEDLDLIRVRSKHTVRETTPVNFWDRADRSDLAGCWLWTGTPDDKGYGRVGYLGHARVGAHRVAWAMTHGGLLPSEWVLHHCDNPPCVNPAHLFLGDALANNRDRHTKGRTVMPTNGPDYWRDKTHCPKGHAYAGENVRYRPDGRRRCAQCYRDRGLLRRDQINARRRALRAERKAAS